jgi:hypothetical protein
MGIAEYQALSIPARSWIDTHDLPLTAIARDKPRQVGSFCSTLGRDLLKNIGKR